MMDFITIPLVVGMVTLGVYKLFELFVRKKERLLMIEKAGENVDASVFQNLFNTPVKIRSKFSSGTLKAGCLLVGVGLGLLVGFLLTNSFVPEYSRDNNWHVRETAGIVYGSSVLLFGGLSLLVAFLLEMNFAKKNE